MTLSRIVDEGLQGIDLPAVTRPAVPFDQPNEELALFAIRLYAYSSIAHIRTILAGVIVLDEIPNTPSAEILCRHIFEWTAHAAHSAENLATHIKQNNWKEAAEVISNFDRANSWIKKHGDKHGALPIQLDAPDAIRLKHWIKAYDRFRIAEYNSAGVEEAYGFLSEHSHPSAACFLQYREISGADIRFVSSGKAPHLPDLDHSLLDWLVLMHRILALAREDTVRRAIVKILEGVVEKRR